jgi:hypothetical protein
MSASQSAHAAEFELSIRTDVVVEADQFTSELWR